ncbi:H-type lectin domain-containing protein [Corallococcus macrosporus]|uniref:H-type lectin domain-containing protein n=1 Tax=Corallococcus macrosporus TaxID=35 RepID=A0ABS3D6N0_9BACT|nr:H-type lectin domain-containing protein [Corallococcus macrosporus]MBN8227314.1 H-type lectin domain-containing protein [Corallococcus macrosporus]
MAEVNPNEIRGSKEVPNIPVGESNRIVEAGGLTIRMGTIYAANLTAVNSPKVIPVRFGKSFASPPAVHLSVLSFDISGSSHRVGMHVTEVYNDSCVIQVYTWADTTIHAVWANWMAIGG